MCVCVWWWDGFLEGTGSAVRVQCPHAAPPPPVLCHAGERPSVPQPQRWAGARLPLPGRLGPRCLQRDDAGPVGASAEIPRRYVCICMYRYVCIYLSIYLSICICLSISIYIYASDLAACRETMLDLWELLLRSLEGMYVLHVYRYIHL